MDGLALEDLGWDSLFERYCDALKVANSRSRRIVSEQGVACPVLTAGGRLQEETSGRFRTCLLSETRSGTWDSWSAQPRGSARRRLQACSTLTRTQGRLMKTSRAGTWSAGKHFEGS